MTSSHAGLSRRAGLRDEFSRHDSSVVSSARVRDASPAPLPNARLRVIPGLDGDEFRHGPGPACAGQPQNATPAGMTPQPDDED